jgi:serine/threonine protein kinase
VTDESIFAAALAIPNPSQRSAYLDRAYFGVVKAVGQARTEKTIYTRFAQMIGTPLYMSPEQAQMSGVDVDTRSDIYTLWVLLYELLTLTTPFERDRFQKAAFDEIRRIIREEEPPRPSTRLTSLGATLTAVSASRGTDPAGPAWCAASWTGS